MDKNSIKVLICGVEYSLKSDENPHHVEMIAKHVEDRIEKLSGTTQVTSQAKIAVLTALNITADLFVLKQNYQELTKKLAAYEEKSKELCENVEPFLAIPQDKD